MRIAVLSDIHGNRQAFAAVLEDAALRGAGQLALLGDLVGYGPDPGWCVDRAMTLVQAGALCLKGNHDAAATGQPEAMNALARAAMDWTIPRLTEAQKAFLAGRPMTGRIGDAGFAHASLNRPEDWIYVTSETQAAGSFRASDARVMLMGHVHRPLLVSRDRTGVLRPQAVRTGMAMPLLRSRRWLGVVGSVGQPRDGSPQAGYALLDLARDELTFLRVPYDVAATAAEIRAAGLPEALAQRLTRGE